MSNQSGSPTISDIALVFTTTEGTRREIPIVGTDLARLAAYLPAHWRQLTEQANLGDEPVLALSVKDFKLVYDQNVPQVVVELLDFIGGRSAYGIELGLARSLAARISAMADDPAAS
jgi:hypothetical protein